jgi:imidazolonepropionase-like amidohydrolase
MLIDGRGGPPISDGVIVIDGPRIVAVGTTGDMPVAPDAQVINLPGSTILPGLIDVHVHVTNDGGAASAHSVLGDVMTPFAVLALRGAANAKRSLDAGYTTLRDLNAFGYADVALRDMLASGRLEGSRLRVSGQGLCITGGHMDVLSLPIHVSAVGRIGIADTPEGFRQAVRAHVKMGVDQIKINCDVSSWRNPSTPWVQEMSYEEMKAACDEAHKYGKPVAAHTCGGPPIEDALRAGIDSVEHGHWLTDRAIELMVQCGAFYVPTLLVNTRNFIDRPPTKAAPTVPESEWSWIHASYEAKWESLAKARAAGVKIAAGSDAGFIVDHGENAEELVELVRGGLTPMEAIVAATKTAAELLHLNDQVGTLEPGKLADVIVVDGDPLQNIEVLCDPARVTHVFQSGRIAKAPTSPIGTLSESTSQLAR